MPIFFKLLPVYVVDGVDSGTVEIPSVMIDSLTADMLSDMVSTDVAGFSVVVTDDISGNSDDCCVLDSADVVMYVVVVSGTVVTLLEQQQSNIKEHKTDAECQQTLGHPRSMNPNMINHVAKQSPLNF